MRGSAATSHSGLSFPVSCRAPYTLNRLPCCPACLPACVQEIDAYWLQRRISKAFGDIDPNAAQKLAEDVFDALQVRPAAPSSAGCARRSYGLLAKGPRCDAGHAGCLSLLPRCLLGCMPVCPVCQLERHPQSRCALRLPGQCSLLRAPWSLGGQVCAHPACACVALAVTACPCLSSRVLSGPPAAARRA